MHTCADGWVQICCLWKIVWVCGFYNMAIAKKVVHLPKGRWPLGVLPGSERCSCYFVLTEEWKKTFSSLKVPVYVLKEKSPSQSHIILDNYPMSRKETSHAVALGWSLWREKGWGSGASRAHRPVCIPAWPLRQSSGLATGLGLPWWLLRQCPCRRSLPTALWGTLVRSEASR